MSMEVEAFIFGKKIGTILLKDGIVYFEYDKEFKTAKIGLNRTTMQELDRTQKRSLTGQ